MRIKTIVGPQSLRSTLSLSRDDVSSLGGADSTTHVSITQATTTHVTTHASSSTDMYIPEPLRLDFSGLNLVGRKNELRLLREVFQRTCHQDAKSEVVLVDGLSGTGKSTLVEATRRDVTIESNGFFVSGKFDQYRNEPLSAIVEAFSDLCDLIAQEYKVDKLRSIVQSLESEYKVLVNLIPSFNHLLGRASSRSIREEGHIMDDAAFVALDAMTGSVGKDMFARFKFSCQRFLQVTSSSKHPILVFLDDLQWADDASIEVIQSLVTDRSSKNVLFVCTHRNNQKYSEPLQSLFQLLQQNQDPATLSPTTTSSKLGLDRPTLRVTRISVRNFDQATVNTMVTSVLNSTEGETQPLSDLVLRRTHGNPYFVVQFLRSLESSGLLRITEEKRVWEWDMTRIRNETSATDNVGELLLSRIQSLSERVQWALKIASCLGFKFERTILDHVLQTIPASGKKSGSYVTRRIDKSLFVAERLGLVERANQKENSVLAFTHDKVHQCMYDMIPTTDNTRAQIHLSIAQALQILADSTASYRDTLICTIADQLNRAKEVIVEDDGHEYCILAAQANLNATKFTMSKSAIPVAVDYARQGVSMLETHRDPWKTNYSLSLALYSTAAQVHFCAGNYIDCNKSVKEVSTNAESVEDSLSARITLFQSLGSKGELEQAIDLAFALSREMGYGLPKRPSYYHALVEMIKTRKLLRGKTNQQLLCQKPIEAMTEQIFVLLGQAAEYAALAMKTPHLCVAVLKLTQLAVSQSCATPPVYAAYGVLQSLLGNYEEAGRFGQLALELQEEQGLSRTLPTTHTLVYTFFRPWTHAIQDSLDPLHHAFQTGMAVGEVEGGFLAILTYVTLAFHCGIGLEEVERVHRQYCEQMCDFENRSKAMLAMPTWQLCLNLMGSTHSLDLNGEALKLIEFEKEARESNNVAAFHALHWAQFTLSYILGSRFGLEQTSSSISMVFRAGSHCSVYCGYVYYCLGLLELCRLRSNRRYKRMIRSIHRLLARNVRLGNNNCVPLAKLVEAEMASQKKSISVDQVKTLYDQAILDASSQELLHLEAIANERAGVYLLDADLPDTAGTYIGASLELFDDWGAAAKVHQMMVKYPAAIMRQESNPLLPINVTTRKLNQKADFSSKCHGSSSKERSLKT